MSKRRRRPGDPVIGESYDGVVGDREYNGVYIGSAERFPDCRLVLCTSHPLDPRRVGQVWQYHLSTSILWGPHE